MIRSLDLSTMRGRSLLMGSVLGIDEAEGGEKSKVGY